MNSINLALKTQRHGFISLDLRYSLIGKKHNCASLFIGTVKSRYESNVAPKLLVYCLTIEVKGIVWHFGKCIYSLSCWNFNEDSDTTLTSHICLLNTKTGNRETTCLALSSGPNKTQLSALALPVPCLCAKKSERKSAPCTSQQHQQQPRGKYLNTCGK